MSKIEEGIILYTAISKKTMTLPLKMNQSQSIPEG